VVVVVVVLLLSHNYNITVMSSCNKSIGSHASCNEGTSSSATAQAAANTASAGGDVAQQLRFPWKLHLLLERCDQQRSLRDVISWMPDGKSFRVHDKERFGREVMADFFGTTNFKTFQRNLNLW
jgi:hypothetical protein